jgi:hypothetical protein
MGVKKEINWDMIELYAKAGCKQIDICKAFHIDEVTLRKRVKEKYDMEWSAFSAALHSEGVLLIKAQQFQKAMKGFWPALQWLGKVDLGQKEPESLNQLPANQAQLDQSHRIMQLEHALAEERAKNDGRE